MSTNGALVRQLGPADAAQFQALRLRGLLECPTAFASSHAEEADTPLHEVAERLAPRADGAVFGAFAGPVLGGVIGLQRERQRKLAHKAFLWGMYVAPASRRHGAGRALVAYALAYAARELGVRQVNLGVNVRNEPAIALYQSLGFRTYGTERGFLLLDGELHDEYHMVRHVAGTD